MSPRLPGRRGCACGALLTLLTAAAIPLGGCAKTNSESGVSYADERHSDSEFDSGGERPPTAKTLYAVVRILMAQDKDAECSQVLKRIIRGYPGFMPAYCDLAEIQARHHRVNEAIATITAGLRVSSRDAVLLNNLGMCWMLKEDYRQALMRFTQAAAARPQDARYRANMAVSLGLLGRYQEALSLYEQVIPETDAQHNVSILRQASLNSTESTEKKAGGRPTVASSRASDDEILPAWIRHVHPSGVSDEKME